MCYIGPYWATAPPNFGYFERFSHKFQLNPSNLILRVYKWVHPYQKIIQIHYFLSRPYNDTPRFIGYSSPFLPYQLFNVITKRFVKNTLNVHPLFGIVSNRLQFYTLESSQSKFTLEKFLKIGPQFDKNCMKEHRSILSSSIG